MNKTSVDKLKLPINNYEIDDYIDNRFKKVKIFVAHTGENLNHTSFSLESLHKMSRSLSYVPIVGYLDKNSMDDIDFSNHRQRIVIEDNNLSIEYLGVPFGFIPENNNINFERREGKEWLTVEGYLWTKFPKAIELFEKANGRKSQSMEIENVEGYMDDEGIFHIEEAQFSALCILGDEVPPAMSGSTIEFFSIDNEFKKEMREMIQEFSMKGDVVQVEDKHEKLDDNLETEVEPTEVEETEVDKVEESQDEEKSETVEEVVVEDTDEAEAPVEAETPTEPTEVAEEYTEQETTTEDEVEVEDETVEEATETETEDVVEDEETDETLENLKKENEALKEKVEQLEKENHSLTSYKVAKETEEKKAVISGYEADLTKEEIEKFNANLSEYTIDTLEKDIVYTIFKKNKGGQAPTSKSYSYDSKQDGMFGELDKYFGK